MQTKIKCQAKITDIQAVHANAIHTSFHTHPHDTDLVGDRQHVVVSRDVDMQHVKLVARAQVVGDAGERRAARLGHAVVDDDQVVHVGAEQRVLKDREMAL